MKISLYIIVLIVRVCFDRTHSFELVIFSLNAHALLLLAQFGINKHLQILFKDHKLQIAILLLVLIFSKLHSKSCDYLYFKRCVVLEVGIFSSLELMLCFALVPDKESFQSTQLLFSQKLNFSQ